MLNLLFLHHSQSEFFHSLSSESPLASSPDLLMRALSSLICFAILPFSAFYFPSFLLSFWLWILNAAI